MRQGVQQIPGGKNTKLMQTLAQLSPENVADETPTTRVLLFS